MNNDKRSLAKHEEELTGLGFLSVRHREVEDGTGISPRGLSWSMNNICVRACSVITISYGLDKIRKICERF